MEVGEEKEVGKRSSRRTQKPLMSSDRENEREREREKETDSRKVLPSVNRVTRLGEPFASFRI